VVDGRVTVSWCIQRDEAAAVLLRLRWAEEGGPKVQRQPARRGFGSRVLDGTVRMQLAGKVELDWQPTGLVCDIEVPLDPWGLQADSVVTEWSAYDALTGLPEAAT
jgi:two-component sensor histidine kinase